MNSGKDCRLAGLWFGSVIVFPICPSALPPPFQGYNPAILRPDRGRLYLQGMSGTLNLIKLCVGCDDPAELEAWQATRWQGGNARHVTRMWPKREAELLDGGSIYWVFKGVLQARQPIVALEEVTGEDGIRRCALILAPGLVRVSAVPRRPFQGWRYLAGADAPPDLPKGREAEPSLPSDIAQALADMGLR